MNIYVAHSRDGFDFQKELYQPLKDSKLAKKCRLIFPHETSDTPMNSKELMSTGKIDILLAEVSFPATGLGIELGWADAYSIPIVCVYRKGTKVSGSLRILTDKFIEYQNGDDLIENVSKILNSF